MDGGWQPVAGARSFSAKYSIFHPARIEPAGLDDSSGFYYAARCRYHPTAF